MIHFVFLLLTFFQPKFLRNIRIIEATGPKFFENGQANNLEKIFEKSKSFEVAYLQLRVEFHSN